MILDRRPTRIWEIHLVQDARVQNRLFVTTREEARQEARRARASGYQTKLFRYDLGGPIKVD